MFVCCCCRWTSTTYGSTPCWISICVRITIISNRQQQNIQVYTGPPSFLHTRIPPLPIGELANKMCANMSTAFVWPRLGICQRRVASSSPFKPAAKRGKPTSRIHVDCLSLSSTRCPQEWQGFLVGFSGVPQTCHGIPFDMFGFPFSPNQQVVKQKGQHN